MTWTLANDSIDYAGIGIGMLGGLSIFLFGLTQMTDALKAVAGASLRTVLARLTRNRFAAAFTGAFVTGVIQSSSVTTVLVVGFISAGLMSLQQSVGVIMGANIGSTVTAQLVAFRITAAALPLITVGFGLRFLTRRDALRQSGMMLMGLGMIFLGMDFMGTAAEPLRDYAPFVDAMRNIDKPLLAVLVAAVFTGLVQSSAATTGLVIVLAGQGFISLEAGIALALGANIGTCATAGLAAIGQPRPAVQAAAVHILFNTVGVLIWLPFITTLAEIVRSFSPAFPDLDAATRLARETPRQIANAHTFFNIANTALFIWFTGPIAKLVVRLLPERPAAVPERARPRFLEKVYLETPALAIDRLRLETARLGTHAAELLDSVRAREDGLRTEGIVAGAEDAAALHGAIIAYAQDLLRGSMSTLETRQVEDVLAAANHFSSIGDTLALNLEPIARAWRERGFRASDESQRMFADLHRLVRRAVIDAAEALRAGERTRADRVVGMKSEVQSATEALMRRLGERLTSPDPHRIEIYRLESDVVELMKRIYYFAKRAAKRIGDVDEAPSRAA